MTRGPRRYRGAFLHEALYILTIGSTSWRGMCPGPSTIACTPDFLALSTSSLITSISAICGESFASSKQPGLMPSPRLRVVLYSLQISRR